MPASNDSAVVHKIIMAMESGADLIDLQISISSFLHENNRLPKIS